MSFSSDVKRELLAQYSTNRHCRLAELAAMLSGSGWISTDDGQIHIIFASENREAAEKYIRLSADAIGVTVETMQALLVQHMNKASCLTVLAEAKTVQKLLSVLKIKDWKEDSGASEQKTMFPLTNASLLKKACCRRAFLRGAFLASGSMSNPKKSYHFEIVCSSRIKAEQIKEQFQSFGLEAKVTARKNHEIVYLKEGAQIVDALNVMGAHVALMDLENVRIIKEMRNDINRRVNCETANINKTVHAAYRQLEAIRYLQQQGCMQELSAQLQEIVRLRMEYPEASIQELGAMCHPKVGKSGVNHRLRKLEEIAVQNGCRKKE